MVEKQVKPDFFCYKCNGPLFKKDPYLFKEFRNPYFQQDNEDIRECVRCQLEAIDPTTVIIKRLSNLVKL
jgi:hypothetical protein